MCINDVKLLRRAGLMISLILLWGSRLSVSAESIEISTAEELWAMADDPAGSYVLTDDIDMTGEEWIPFSFQGTLDGNGHAILNLSVKTTGEASRET